MPKTKTVYNKRKQLVISDKGNQMLASLWRFDQSDSEAQFIRDAIVFYLKQAMPKEVVSFWENENVPEINDFAKSREFDKIKKTKEATQKYLDKRITGEITFTRDTNKKNKK